MRRKVVAPRARLRETARHAPRFRHPVSRFAMAFRMKNGLVWLESVACRDNWQEADYLEETDPKQTVILRVFALESFLFWFCHGS